MSDEAGRVVGILGGTFLSASGVAYVSGSLVLGACVAIVLFTLLAIRGPDRS